MWRYRPIGENSGTLTWLRRSSQPYKLPAMGSWGITPAENDAALDWLQQRFNKAALAAYLKETLNLDLREHPDEIRVAARFVHAMTEAELWPHDTRAKFTELAVLRLEQLIAEKFSQTPTTFLKYGAKSIHCPVFLNR